MNTFELEWTGRRWPCSVNGRKFRSEGENGKADQKGPYSVGRTSVSKLKRRRAAPTTFPRMTVRLELKAEVGALLFLPFSPPCPPDNLRDRALA